MTHLNEYTHDARWRGRAGTWIRIATGVTLLAFFALLSWNMFAPEVFGWPTLNLKQALGMVALAGLATYFLGRVLGANGHD